MPQKSRRSAAETRAEIRRVALELFTEQGFDATTTRDIAAALGMNQSSLYYHFVGKDEIVLRWLDTTTEEHVHGQRLALANPAAQRRLTDNGRSMADTFDRIVAVVAGPDAPATEALYIRTVFNAVGSVLTATPGRHVQPADIIAAARRMVLAMTQS
jgi:AcrR family transcriptional regulator